jgi:hypothetical protein
MHVLGPKRARLDDALDLDDRNAARARRVRVEVARRGLEDNVAACVSNVALDERKVACDGLPHGK